MRGWFAPLSSSEQICVVRVIHAWVADAFLFHRFLMFQEAAMLILSSKSSEEAIKIFTEGVKPVACIRDKTYVNLVDNDDEEEEEDDDEMMDYFEMEQTYRPSF
ncbi:Phosphatidylserine decarboxylase [Musa troglodytarum]|uniref:Phosphatidylserine decarboxylase n=1 Tax=Musa troglodytarum TaxID=320322 RepID=A0A9E7HY55_9LILI|nr:Phosphatidylserine decarboxylase [Musa troglodytarum]